MVDPGNPTEKIRNITADLIAQGTDRCR